MSTFLFLNGTFGAKLKITVKKMMLHEIKCTVKQKQQILPINFLRAILNTNAHNS